MTYLTIIVIDVVVVLLGYVLIGKIAEKQLKTVRRCEDAETIIEERRNRRTILCVVGLGILLCMVKAIIIVWTIIMPSRYECVEVAVSVLNPIFILKKCLKNLKKYDNIINIIVKNKVKDTENNTISNRELCKGWEQSK